MIKAMKKIGSRFLMMFVFGLACGCAGRILQHEKSDEALKVDEYEQKISIQEVAVEPPPQPVIIEESAQTQDKTKRDDKKPAKSSNKKSKAKEQSLKEKPAKDKKVQLREPDIEDREGFLGRRPIVDPFRPGEKVSFDVSYFSVVAGQVDVEVKPFASVNGERAYHFEVMAKTNGFFSRVYGVEDKATTYLSFDELLPVNLQISIKESKQLAETRTFFDWKTLKASYWQKRITKDKGEQSKKIEWEILPYSQNVISALYYMRVFQMEPGKKLAFRVADEGKNIVFKGDILRREKLSTAIGEINTLVIKPEITVDGVFKPVGDILIWLTDDERKFVVRIESKIKIGTIVAKLKSIDKGKD